MLTKPRHGWTTITIGSESFIASDITDVPIDFLDAFINILASDISQAIDIDSEGSYRHIVITSNAIHIISHIDKYYYYTYELDDYNILYDLADELCNDIKKHLLIWDSWFYVDSEKELLREKLDELEYIVRSHK